jgi:hypothetical protein
LPCARNSAANGNVARLEPFAVAVGIVDEFLRGGFGVLPVFSEDGGTAKLDFALSIRFLVFGDEVACTEGRGQPTEPSTRSVKERPQDRAMPTSVMP